MRKRIWPAPLRPERPFRLRIKSLRLYYKQPSSFKPLVCGLFHFEWGRFYLYSSVWFKDSASYKWPKKVGCNWHKKVFAAITFSRSVQRTPNSIIPPLYACPRNSGTQATVTGGNGIICLENCFGILVFHALHIGSCNVPLGSIEDLITLLHFESKPTFHVSGKPTKTCRSLMVTGAYMFLAARWNTLLDSPGCTGIRIQPLIYVWNIARPFGKSANLTISRSNKKSFVSTNVQSGDSPICIKSPNSGLGGGLEFTYTAIATGNRLTIQTDNVFHPIPQKEQITPCAIARLRANRQSFQKL